MGTEERENGDNDAAAVVSRYWTSDKCSIRRDSGSDRSSTRRKTTRTGWLNFVVADGAHRRLRARPA